MIVMKMLMMMTMMPTPLSSRSVITLIIVMMTMFFVMMITMMMVMLMTVLMMMLMMKKRQRLLCKIPVACIVHQMIDCWWPKDKMHPKQYNDGDDGDNDHGGGDGHNCDDVASKGRIYHKAFIQN